MSKKVKYTGKLADRSTDLPPEPPATSVLGSPSEESVQEHRRDTNEWIKRQLQRELEGIPLLLEHYEIQESKDQFLHLALALARDHVPYFMFPARGRGRRKSNLTSMLLLIDGLAKAMKSAGQPQSFVYKTFAEILGLEVDTVEREVKRFRRDSERGTKEN